MANRFYWLKLLRDFYEDPYIKYLKNTNSINGRMLITIYQEIMLLTLSNDGVLENLPLYPSVADYIADTCNERLEDVRNTISYFAAAGLLELMDNDTLFCPYVCQNTGSKSDSAVRMEKARAKKKLEAQNIQLLEASQCDIKPSQSDKNVTQSIEFKNIDIDIKYNLLNKYKEKTGKHNNIVLQEKEYLYLAEQLVYPQKLIDDVSEWIFKTKAKPADTFATVIKFLENDKNNNYVRTDDSVWLESVNALKNAEEEFLKEKSEREELTPEKRISFMEKCGIEYDPKSKIPLSAKKETSAIERLEDIISLKSLL